MSQTKRADNNTILTEEQLIDLQKSFNDYWADKADRKGKGYKQFKRWEWMVETRLTKGQSRSKILWEEYLNESKKSVSGDWNFLGPNTPAEAMGSGFKLGSGRIDCIEFHPSDRYIFWVGAPTGGLWKTINGGSSWTCLTDGLPAIGISDIAVDPVDPDIIYIATGDRDSYELYSTGVLRTINGGETWESTALSLDPQNGDYEKVFRLALRPDDHTKLLAATNNGIYLLSNQGQSKQRVSGTYEGEWYMDIEFHPTNPQIVYAAKRSGGYSTVYQSTNGGQSFSSSFIATSETSEIARIELAVSKAAPNNVYALCTEKQYRGFHALYYSSNSGETWTKFTTTSKNLLGRAPDGSDTGGQGTYDLALAVSPSDAGEVYVGGINIWKTTNEGDSWQLNSYGSSVAEDKYVHVDQHILEFHPLTGALYSGNDGGIFKSSDNGQSWSNLSSNLGILQIYRIGQSASYSNKIMMGSQDNSSIFANSNNFNVVKGGDGMECIIDKSDTNIIYASSQFGNIARSDNGGDIFSGIQPNPADEGAWVTPYITDPKDNKIIYAAYTHVYRSADRGIKWEKIETSIDTVMYPTYKYRSLAISPANNDIIAGATHKQIWISDNRGKNWVEITFGLPIVGTGTISYIIFDEHDPNKLWLSITGYNKGEKVFYSNDAGNNWINYSEGLPNVPANCLVQEKGSRKGLYAGTDLGVYYRNKDMSSWINFSDGLPNVIVNELEIFYPDSLLRAGSYGRGLWESPLYSQSSNEILAGFSADRHKACTEGEVLLTSSCNTKADSLKWNTGDAEVLWRSVGGDSIKISYAYTGAKETGLTAWKNGISDQLNIPGYIEIYDEHIIDLSVSQDYIWKGDSVILEASGAYGCSWNPISGLEINHGNRIRARIDSNITYHVRATDGTCHDEADLMLDNIYLYDSVKNAMELEFAENGPFVNIGAKVEENEPHPPLTDCNTQMSWCDEFGTGEGVLGSSVWFRFTAPSSGIVSLDTRGFDNQIAVYDSDSPSQLLSGNYRLLAANDDYHGEDMNYSSSIRKIEELTTGKTYWVQVDGSGGNSTGTFYINLRDQALGKKMLYTGSSILIYPNPGSGMINIIFEDPAPGRTRLEVYNIQGSLLFSEIFDLREGQNEINAKQTISSPGLYLLKISNPEYTIVKKIVVKQ